MIFADSEWTLLLVALAACGDSGSTGSGPLTALPDFLDAPTPTVKYSSIKNRSGNQT